MRLPHDNGSTLYLHNAATTVLDLRRDTHGEHTPLFARGTEDS
jgi:hypothetical protein